MPGFAVYGRLEGSVPLGSIHQSFEEVFRLNRTDRLGESYEVRYRTGRDGTTPRKDERASLAYPS